MLVASRGAIAARVLKALHQMGIPSVAVYSEADAGAPYLELATETYTIGAAAARESYLDQDKILHVIENSQCRWGPSRVRLSVREHRRRG